MKRSPQEDNVRLAHRLKLVRADARSDAREYVMRDARAGADSRKGDAYDEPNDNTANRA